MPVSSFYHCYSSLLSLSSFFIFVHFTIIIVIFHRSVMHLSARFRCHYSSFSLFSILYSFTSSFPSHVHSHNPSFPFIHPSTHLSTPIPIHSSTRTLTHPLPSPVALILTHPSLVAGGDQTSAVLVPGYRLFHLRVDGVQISGHPRASI